MATLTEIEKLKVADLRKELKVRGLSVQGNKAELIERLQLALNSETADNSVTEEINEDDVLGDDEILAVDAKAGNSLLSDDSILSPVLNRNPPVIEKENANVTPKISPVTKADSKEAKAFCETSTSVKVLSPQDRLELRAKRFCGQGTEEIKKQARAERFGIETSSGKGNVTNGASVATNLSKLQQRAERFGVSISKSLKQLDDKNRLQKRKERFGAVVIPSAKGLEIDANDKKQKRAERFKMAL